MHRLWVLIEEILRGKREVAWRWRKEARSLSDSGPGCLKEKAGQQVWVFCVASGPCEQLLGGFTAF